MASEHPQRAWGRAQRRGELLQQPARATHHAARGPAGAAPHPRHQPQGGRGAAGHLQQLERQDAAAGRPAALGEHRGDRVSQQLADKTDKAVAAPSSFARPGGSSAVSSSRPTSFVRSLVDLRWSVTYIPVKISFFRPVKSQWHICHLQECGHWRTTRWPSGRRPRVATTRPCWGPATSTQTLGQSEAETG